MTVATRLFITQVVISLLFIVQNLLNKKEAGQEQFFNYERAMMIGIPSVLALFIASLAHKYTFLIELCAPVYVLTSTITILFQHLYMHQGETSIERFNGQTFVIDSSLYICAFFLTPSYLP